METIRETLEGFPFWNHLTADEQREMLNRSAIRTYEKDAVLHANTGECLGMVTLLSGRVRTLMTSDEGREITLYTLESGDSDVLSATCVINQLSFDTSMVADTACSLLIVPASLLAVMKEKNIYLNNFLMEIAADRFSEVMWTMQQILFRRIDARIAALLLRESGRTGSLTLRLTGEQIAKEINSVREVVARMLKHMQQDGLLTASRGEIVLTDVKRLRALAE